MSNDRLKFRAWYAGRMYFLSGMQFDEGELYKVFLSEDGDSVVDTWAKIADEGLHVMQWTGLYDSDGAEIYDCDLLRHPEFDYPIRVTWYSEDAKFQSSGTVSEWSRCKLIGNKHEDPLVWEASNG